MGSGARRLPRRSTAPEVARGGDLPPRPPARPAAPGGRHPRRPAAAGGAAAQPGPARRAPRRRPPLHPRRGRGVPQPGDGLDLDRRRRRRRWRSAPRAGSPGFSSPPCRCAASPTEARSPASSTRSPAATGSSSTTSPTRSWPANPTTCATSCCGRRSSTGSAGRCVTRSPAGPTAAGCWRTSIAATCSSSRWTPSAPGTATTTCSPTCCGPACRPSSPTLVPRAAPAGQRTGTPRHGLAEDAVRHALAGRGLRPRGLPDGGSAAGRSAAPGRTACCSVGSGRCRTVVAPQPGAEHRGRLVADAGRRPRRTGGLARRRRDGAGRRRPRRGPARPWADTEDLRTAPATIAVYRASLAQARGDIAGTVRHARRALELAGPDDHLVRGGGGRVPRPGRLGRRRHRRRPRHVLRGGRAACTPPGTWSTSWTATIALADMWVAAGRPSRARRLYEQALRPRPSGASRTREPPPTCTSAWPSWTGARRPRRRARRTWRRPASWRARLHHREPAPLVRGHGQRARRHAATSTPRRSCSTEAAALYRPGFYPDVRPIAAIRARLHIAAGDLPAAAAWAPKPRASPSRRPRLPARVRAPDPGPAAAGAAPRTPGRQRPRRPLRSPGPAARPARRRRSATAACSRSGCCKPSPITPTATSRQALTDPRSGADAEAPEPDSHVRLFLDEGDPMLGLLRDAAAARTR